jgi:DNA-binding GntR family transcriptional regulator
MPALESATAVPSGASDEGMLEGLFADDLPLDDADASLAEKVYRHVVAGIHSGHLTPKSRLTQRSLANQLRVSQVAVREALERLAQHGWIERSRNRGACIRSFSDQDRREIYWVREMIEAAAVRQLARTVTEEQIGKLKEILEVLSLACANHDVELYEKADIHFHRLLVRFVGNRRLREYYETLVRQVRCFLMVGALKVAFHWVESCELLEQVSHYKIWEAIKSRDPDLAEKLLRRHISFANEVIEMVHRSREL